MACEGLMASCEALEGVLKADGLVGGGWGRDDVMVCQDAVALVFDHDLHPRILFMNSLISTYGLREQGLVGIASLCLRYVAKCLLQQSADLEWCYCRHHSIVTICRCDQNNMHSALSKYPLLVFGKLPSFI